jgi:phosphoglycerate dehydrogenase-like enzyme
MHVIAYNRSKKTVPGVKMVSLEELLKQSDVVSLHVPLTAETENIVGKKELALMKKTAILINVARAQCVDTEAVYQALKAHTIRGAALDLVTTLDKNHPLLKLDNVVFTPHIGSYTEEAFYSNMPEMIVENVESFVVGRPQNIVSFS